MAVFRDPGALAKTQRLRAEAMKRQLRIGHRELANDMYKEGFKLLSGDIKQRDLDAMGHPFGRRDTPDGKPGRQRRVKGLKTLMPTLPINYQSGKLRDALRLSQRNQGEKQVFVLQVLKSLAPYARYILSPSGTTKMVTRPFWASLQKLWKRKNFELLIKMRTIQKAKH